MPIVGSFAGASARAYGLGAGVALPGDFESISTVTVGTAVTSISFSSIPATYTHLQIRASARTPTTADNIICQFNGDTANNYSTHYISGNGASASSGASTTINYMFVSYVLNSANVYNAFIVDVLDYANTNKYKTLRSLSGSDLNGSGYAQLYSGNWRNTNAITSITIKTLSSVDISQYSSFALYGVKA